MRKVLAWKFATNSKIIRLKFCLMFMKWLWTFHMVNVTVCTPVCITHAKHTKFIAIKSNFINWHERCNEMHFIFLQRLSTAHRDESCHFILCKVNMQIKFRRWKLLTTHLQCVRLCSARPARPNYQSKDSVLNVEFQKLREKRKKSRHESMNK